MDREMSKEEIHLVKAYRELKTKYEFLEHEVKAQRHLLFHNEAYVAELHQWIKSDSVYTLLRYGTKRPSSSGVDDCEDDHYSDLYNLSTSLRKADREDIENRNDAF